MKTSELAGAQLDAVVAKLEGRPHWIGGRDGPEYFSPSIDGAAAVPIMEREGIHVAPMPAKGSTWCAVAVGRLPERSAGGRGVWVEGPTLLVAAMRAYVLAKMGPEVPDSHQ